MVSRFRSAILLAAFVAKRDWIPGHCCDCSARDDGLSCDRSARDDSQRAVRRFFEVTAFFFGLRRSRTHASNSAAGSGWQKK